MQDNQALLKGILSFLAVLILGIAAMAVGIVFLIKDNNIGILLLVASAFLFIIDGFLVGRVFTK